jgi:DNA-binding GntR family transcriptional regulator
LKGDDIYRSLEEAIVQGVYSPGQILRQELLARTFGVSRTPIREALRQLEATGLVSLVAHRGACVRLVSSEELREAFVVRAELEGRAAALAAGRVSGAQFARMDSAQTRLMGLGKRLIGATEDDGRRELVSEWAQADDAFHDAVLEACGVALLVDSARSCRRIVTGRLFASSNAALEALFSQTTAQHRTLRELLEVGSSTGARAAMRDHIQSKALLVNTAVFGAVERTTSVQEASNA